MGDLNHLLFVQKFRKELAGPVLEVGSRDYGNTQSLRPLFAGESYVGADIVEGDGVDLVLDLTRPFEEVSAGLEERRFRTIFCLSVLEHCEQPFRMAENITRLREPGGKVYTVDDNARVVTIAAQSAIGRELIDTRSRCHRQSRSDSYVA